MRQNSVEALGREWRRRAVLSVMRRVGSALRWSKWRGDGEVATTNGFQCGAGTHDGRRAGDAARLGSP